MYNSVSNTEIKIIYLNIIYIKIKIKLNTFPFVESSSFCYVIMFLFKFVKKKKRKSDMSEEVSQPCPGESQGVKRSTDTDMPRGVSDMVSGSVEVSGRVRHATFRHIPGPIIFL